MADFSQLTREGARKYAATIAAGVAGISTIALLAASSLVPLLAGFAAGNLTAQLVANWLGGVGGNALATWLDEWSRKAAGRAIGAGDDEAAELVKALARALGPAMEASAAIADGVARLLGNAQSLETALAALRERSDRQVGLLQLLLEDLQRATFRNERLHDVTLNALSVQTSQLRDQLGGSEQRLMASLTTILEGVQRLHNQDPFWIAQRRDRVRAARELLYDNPVECLLQLYELQAEAEREPGGWEKVSRDDLAEAITWCRRRLSSHRDHLRQFLLEMSGSFRDQESDRLRALSELIVATSGGRVNRQQLQASLQLLAGPPAQLIAEPERALEVALALLRWFKDDAFELAVAVLEPFAVQPRGTASFAAFEAILRRPYPATASEALHSLLLADPRIRKPLVDLLPWTYQWPEQPPATVAVEHDGDTKKWLDAHQFQAHPFEPDTVQSLLPAQLAMQQVHREPIMEPRPMLLFGSKLDCQLTASAFYNTLRFNPNASALPLTVALPPQLTAKGEAELVAELARAVGEAWLRLLPMNPGALFGLEDYEQKVLVEWLLWTTGSPAMLDYRFRKPEQPFADDLLGQVVTRHLLEVAKRLTQPANPAPATLYRWLSLRPPGITHTYLILLSLDESGQRRSLLSLLAKLHSHSIVAKLFVVGDRLRAPKGLAAHRLEWTPRQLRNLVDACVSGARGDPQRLDHLVNDLSEDEAAITIDRRFAQVNGSFAEALAICHQAVIRHVARLRRQKMEVDINNPEFMFLDPSDFEP